MCDWLPVLGYEGLYEVSSDGQVRSLDRTVLRNGRPMTVKGRIMRQLPALTGGYMTIRLSKAGKSKLRFVANLVCEAFHGARPKGKFAAHDNGIRTDNREENLAWKTRKENEADKIIHGTKLIGGKVTGAKLVEAQVVEIRRLRAVGKTYQQIADEMGIGFEPVRGVCGRGQYSDVREAA